jgi:hypothetical protein
MTTESKRLTPEMEKLRREITEARARAAKFREKHPGEPFPFMRMKGILKGKVNFTDEEIEAAKIRPRELPPE